MGVKSKICLKWQSWAAGYNATNNLVDEMQWVYSLCAVLTHLNPAFSRCIQALVQLTLSAVTNTSSVYRIRGCGSTHPSFNQQQWKITPAFMHALVCLTVSGTQLFHWICGRDLIIEQCADSPINASSRFEWQTVISQSACADKTHQSFSTTMFIQRFRISSFLWTLGNWRGQVGFTIVRKTFHWCGHCNTFVRP